jgi:ATP-dependent RNA helicase DHX36
VAKRVAEERGERLGESVGFQIRLENQLPQQRGSILYCTTGILLRRMINDPKLREVSHVVLDEVHERSIQSDFLTIILRDILPHRPDLKVILMSATLNAQLFSQYFGGVPMFNIPSVVFPVAQYFLEDILQMTRYCPPPPSRRGPPPWVRFLKGQRDAFEKKQREEQDRSDYITSLEAKRTYPPHVVEALRNMDHDQISLDLILELIKVICREQESGAILVFLPGWDTISKLHDMLKADPVFRSRNYLIIPLHSLMPTSFQQSVFDRPPEGVRKIVIATNIAETSITIEDVVYVIDCGKVKETTYDVNNQLACLEAVWVSKAAARQRKGRAGRVQPGKSYHLFTQHQLGVLADYQLPEMLRTPLEELVLQIKILKLGAAAAFLDKAIEPPSETAVLNALSCLRQLNALDNEERLTPLGYHLANLPVNPRIGKIILFAAMFSCLSPVLTIAGSLGFKEPFVIPLHKQEEADEVKRRFAEESRSDHIALLRAFEGWEEARLHGNAREYCWQSFLSQNTLELLKNMKKQFCGLLYDTGFLHSPDPNHDEANYNSGNTKLVKAVLCAGLYPNVAKIVQSHPDRPPKLFTQDSKVKFHPKSVNSDETSFDNKFVIYHTKVKSSAVFLHDTSMIPPFPLLFFGGSISVERDGDQQIIAVDKWIKFQAPHHIAKLVKEMREQLDIVLQQKVSSPRMDLYTPLSTTPPASSQLIQSIIDLIASEDYQWQAQRLAAGKHLYIRGAK